MSGDGNDIDWNLSSCCSTNQLIVIGTIGASLLVILLLWRTPILSPFKVIAVFLHELGHALAAIFTCGKVESMRVDPNEGGATQTRGGLMCCILPAGYLGSAFWGAFFIIMAALSIITDNITIRIAAGILILLSLYILIFKCQNNYLRYLLIGLIVILIIIWVIDEFIWENNNLLMCALLFFGVMNSIYAILDIYDDLIKRSEPTSDAAKFAELTKTSTKLWGFLWCIWSIIIFLGAVYFATIFSGMDQL